MDRAHGITRREARRGPRWAAAVVACGALLSGCGSGDGWPAAAGATDTPVTTSPAPATTPAPGDGTGTGPTSAGTGGPGGPAGSGESGGSGQPDGGGAVGGGTTGPGDGGQDTAQCHTSELAGSVVRDPGGGAAGSSYVTLVLRNESDRTCVLRGFPGVSYVGGEDGHQVGPSAAMSGDHGQPVRLGSGGAAGATVRVVNVQNFDPDACRPEPVRGLRVYPPGETDSLFIPMDGTGCGGTPPGDQLAVEAVTPR